MIITFRAKRRRFAVRPRTRDLAAPPCKHAADARGRSAGNGTRAGGARRGCLPARGGHALAARPSPRRRHPQGPRRSRSPQSWQVAWDGHALAHQPLHFFQSNQFWPLHDTLAFSDALVGYAPVGCFGSGPHAAVFRYDLLFLFAYALAFAGAYLLARELGLGPGAAAVAGAAFAFAPFRLEQDGHMQVISSGGIPLALPSALRGYRLAPAGWVVGGWAVAAWQLSIGFTLGLPLGYLLAAIWLIAAIVWLRRGPPAPRPRAGDRDASRARSIFVAAGLAAQPPVRAGRRRASRRRKRTPADVEAFSGPPWIFLVAPDENLVWGGCHLAASGRARERPREDPVPGPGDPRPRDRRALARPPIRAGCDAGSAWAWWRSRCSRSGSGQGAGCCGRIGSSTSSCPAGRRSGCPGRLVDVLVAGACAARRAPARSERSRATRRRPAVPVAAAAAAVAAPPGARGRDRGPGASLRPVRQPGPAPGAAGAALRGRRFPRRSFTCRPSAPTDNRRYLLWSTDGFPAIVNGRSSLNPAFTERPDRARWSRSPTGARGAPVAARGATA